MDTFTIFAKGGGGKGGGGARSSTKSSSSKPSATSSPPPKPAPTTKPTSNTVATTTAKKPSAQAKKGKQYNEKGSVVGDTYQPRFTSGYVPPKDSVVYYPQHSFIDYLPWIYIFSQGSPQHDQVAVVQPDGKEVVAKPETEGVDGLLILNWFILIVLALAIIVGVVWGVNKLSKRKV